MQKINLTYFLEYETLTVNNWVCETNKIKLRIYIFVVINEDGPFRKY